MSMTGEAGTKPFGLILAGGLSRRMGGGDKTLSPLGNGTVLDAVIRRVGPQCEGLAINANGDPTRFAAFGLPVLPDTLPGHLGPLAGVLTGLAAIRARGLAWLLTVPGDTPFLPLDLVIGLAEAALRTGALAAFAASTNKPHPVMALWSVTLYDRLSEALTHHDVRRVMAFHDAVKAVAVPWPDTARAPFFNINHPEDLDAAWDRWLREG